MSKIVKAINAMVSNEKQIDNVKRGRENNELFFIYAKKHKWSILKDRNDEFSLSYYPGNQALEELAGKSVIDFRNFNEIVSYESRDLGTTEALASLSELYTIVQEKLFGVDDLLDEIISNW